MTAWLYNHTVVCVCVVYYEMKQIGNITNAIEIKGLVKRKEIEV